MYFFGDRASNGVRNVGSCLHSGIRRSTRAFYFLGCEMLFVKPRYARKKALESWRRCAAKLPCNDQTVAFSLACILCAVG